MPIIFAKFDAIDNKILGIKVNYVQLFKSLWLLKMILK